MTIRIGLATCARLPEPDPDDAPLRAALRGAGAEPALIAWDDPSAEVTGLDLCVLRSTWNYFEAPERFLAWAQRVDRATRLVNPIDIVRWNIHKRYLRELEAGGVPIVPTAWVGRGESASLEQLLARRGWRAAVVKPCISAASFLTRRFGRDEIAAGQAFLNEHVRTRDMMVQRYMDSVDGVGERSIIWIDGAATHTVTKRPRFAGGEERTDVGPSPGEAELALVDRALAGVRDRVLYARIDVMYDDAGSPMVSEVELIEPSLFFPHCPAALDRFVAALLRRG